MADLRTFYHGVEHSYERQQISAPQTPNGTVAYIGTAPIHQLTGAGQVNRMMYIGDLTDAVARMGVGVAGYTLPEAADIHFKEGGARAIFINVFDPAVDRVAFEGQAVFGASNIAELAQPVVTNAAGTVTYGRGVDWEFDRDTGRLARLARGAIPDGASVKLTGLPWLAAPATISFAAADIVAVGAADLINATVTNVAGTTAYTAGTDYTLDPVSGRLTRPRGSTIPAGGTVKVAGWRGNPAAVTPARIIGGIAVDGSKSGLALLADSWELLGTLPHIIVVPDYGHLEAVWSAANALAEALDVIVLTDMAAEMTGQEALESRGVAGAYDYAVSSVSLGLCWPPNTMADPLGADRPVSAAVGVAAVWSRTINDEGINISPSNRPYRYLRGSDRPVATRGYASLGNQLNAAGIITHRVGRDSGPRVWGNWSSGFPVERDPIHFLAQKHANAVVDHQLDLLMMQYIDKRLNRPLIEQIVDVVQAYYNQFIGREMLGAHVQFLPADNPVEQLAQGILVLLEDRGWAPPLTRIVRRARYDKNALTALYGG